VFTVNVRSYSFGGAVVTETKEPFVLRRPERRTEVHTGYIVQILYGYGYGKMVSDRMTTFEGRTVHEQFEPWLHEKNLPDLPTPALPAGEGAERGRRRGRSRDAANPRDLRKSRTFRLRAARASALSE
jgi:hypothetical protein